MIEVTATRKCDRCGKDISTVTIIDEQVVTDNPPSFTASFEGREASYTDLCDKCRKVLGDLVDRALLVKSDAPSA